MNKQELANINEQFQKALEHSGLLGLLPRQANQRYWRRGHYAYAWTTEPVKGKFYATKWRILKDGSWKSVHRVCFGRRKIAKARARKWFEESQ